MNILFLAHRIPYPPNKGDKIRSFNTIRYLSGKHDLYLAFIIDDEKDCAYLDDLRKYSLDLDYALIRPRRQNIKAVPYLLTNKPISVPHFYSRKLQEAIDRRLSTCRIDAIVCFSSAMAEYVFRSNSNFFKGTQAPNGTKLIMDFVDMDSDKWRMYAGFSSFPFSHIFRREWKTLMSYERKIGTSFDRGVFVSEKEVELFKSFCPEAHAVSIPNGVDTDLFLLNQACQTENSSDAPKGQDQPNILFIGAMDYFPNEDAVLYFSSKIWPLVKKRLPQAKFYIVGRKPSAKVNRLSGADRNIIVTGGVPDVKPYLILADVFVAPLRIARGLQNKVLEAMASGVPVVASPEAMQGFNGGGKCIEVAESSESFVFSILKVLGDPQLRQRMVNDSRIFIMEHHNWEDNLKMWDHVLVK